MRVVVFPEERKANAIYGETCCDTCEFCGPHTALLFHSQEKTFLATRGVTYSSLDLIVLGMMC